MILLLALIVLSPVAVAVVIWVVRLVRKEDEEYKENPRYRK